MAKVATLSDGSLGFLTSSTSVNSWRPGVGFAIVLKSFCLTSLAVLLIACNSSASLPVTGEVRLNYLRQSQSYMYFRLANQTSNKIFFRGTYDRSVGADPWNAWMECAYANSESWTPGPYVLVDGTEAVVGVDSGEQLELITGIDFRYKFVGRFPGARCRLNLELQDGSVIKSNEFGV